MNFIFDPSLVLYLPLYQLGSASFMSKDAYGHLCVVTGALWRPNGYYFDGTDDFIGSIGSVSSLSFIQNTGIFTLGVWLKFDDHTADAFQSIMANGTGVAQKGFYFIYENRSGTATKELRMALMRGGSYVGCPNSDTNAIADNEWHNIFVTGDGTNVIYYVDTIPDEGSETLGTKSTGDSTNQMEIGRLMSPAAGQLAGSLGEVWIYNRALTPQEIQHNYLATKGRYR